MTIEEKMNYIINVLAQITEGSKDIGQLEEYDVQADSAQNYVPVYSAVDNKTRRANIDQLIEDLTGGVPNHTHEANEINGLGDYKVISILDTNSEPWRVERQIDDITEDPFKTDDRISGWEDGTKTTYYEGIVLDDTIVIPADLNNSAKFFITRKINKIS